MEAVENPVFLDAMLRPNPPMPAAALGWILVVVSGINLAFAILFLARGAWPVTPFMGADVFALAWAFHASRVASRAFEHVKVTASDLSVLAQSGRGETHQTVFNSYWVRVDLHEPQDMPRKLTLKSHGKILQVGSFLGPRERLSFSQALKAALASARNWRPPQYYRPSPSTSAIL